MDPILVFGAAGKTGYAVASELLQQGAPVRAMVRAESARAQHLRALGADIILADMGNEQALAAASTRVQSVYWVAPFDPQALDAAQIFARVARANGVPAIVQLSQWLASPVHPAFATRQAWQTEQIFGAIDGLSLTVLDPGFFADNYLRLIGFAAQLGILPSLTRGSRNAPPSTEDIARVAAAILINPAPHKGQRYRPTGPELLSTKDMARILSDVLGHSVFRMEMPMWLFLKAARMQGVSPYELSGYRHYVRDHRAGSFERGAPNNLVQSLTGKAAEPFALTAARYAALPEAQRSFTARLRAFADFMRTPMMPGYHLRSFDKRHKLLLADSKALYSFEDPDWKQGHPDRKA